MSTNIHINATGDAIYPNGKTYKVFESFNCLQTPSTITAKILASKTPEKEYIEWVLSNSKDEELPIYDFDKWVETTDDNAIIGYKTYNFGKEHVKQFKEWMKDVQEKGLEISYAGY